MLLINLYGYEEAVRLDKEFLRNKRKKVAMGEIDIINGVPQ